MRWTNKTLALVQMTILYSFLLLHPICIYAQGTVQGSPVDGSWLGSLDIGGGRSLRLALHIKADAENTLHIQLDSLDQGAIGIPATNGTFKDGHLSFDVPSIHGKYHGSLSKDGNKLHGSWDQGKPLPLNFERTTSASTATAVPDEPKPPFPYAQDDVVISKESGVELSGTFTRPKTNYRVPVVLLVGGSGPEDRDETIFGHKPFLVIADFLTRQGIAVLRMDRRGVGKSTGSLNNATIADLASDTLAAVAYLKDRSDVDSRHIGLIGHSEGAMIASLATTQTSDISFLILLASPGVPGIVLLPEQVYQVVLASGGSVQTADSSRQQEAITLAILAKTSATDVLIASFKARFSGTPELDQLMENIPILTSAIYRDLLTYDPFPILKKVTCPVLALNGDKDTQVPAYLNLPFIRVAVLSNKSSDVEELPHLNHLFQTARTGAPTEYASIGETISPVVLHMMSAWIQKRIADSSGN